MWIAAPEEGWLRDLCRQLVEARLASSAHVVFPIASVYRWNGQVQEATEARAFLRTRRRLVRSVVAFVLKRHPYEVPNVTVMPIVDGNATYLEWTREGTIGP